MSLQISSEQVWEAIGKELFAVLGMVTAAGEARTVGIVYIVQDGRFYIGTDRAAWKTKHIERNHHVSMTIPIPKRIPLLPWIKIPAATITFAGEAAVYLPYDLPTELLHKLFRAAADDEQKMAQMSVIEVTPVGDFLTYGVGVPLLIMRQPELARARVPTAPRQSSLRNLRNL